jgi:perosamine synthetase
VKRFAVAPRLRLDLGVRDLAAGVAYCAVATDARREEQRLLDCWGAPGEGIACLSVRSAFDLLLSALRLPVGSEVAFTASTHPDMPRIATAHGLRIVALDLDPDTLAPTAEALSVIGPDTRLVVVAHLFGGRVELGPISERARSQGALVIEDCAQAFRGPLDRGDLLADVSLYSFGAIKTATALGGALVRIRDASLLAAVRDAQAGLERQTRRRYLAKLLRFSGLLFVGRPLPYGLLLHALAAAGRDPDVVVNGLVKAFPHAQAEPGADDEQAAELLRRIRRQPSAPLLALVHRRLRRFDAGRLERRAAFGERARRALPEALRHVGGHASYRTHWVFPVLAADPAALVEVLRGEGVDASRGTSSIEVVRSSPGAPIAHAAQRMMDRVVFVPVYPELGEQGLERHLEALRLAALSQPAVSSTPGLVPA